MLDIRSLGYVLIESPDPAQWREYGTEVLGLMPSPIAPERAGTYLKMDPRPWRFGIQKGKQNRYLLAGWELADQREFMRAQKELKKLKISFKVCNAKERAHRGVAGLLRLQDPSGNTLELYHGGGLDYLPFVSPLEVSGFETGDDGSLGLGHAVLTAPKLEETHDFYRDVLGFGDSDYMEVPNPDGSVTGLHFMHCNNPRHHSVALYGMPAEAFPGGCVHLMVEVNNVDEVGACLDRVNERNIHIFSTLGRHTNDRMLSFYMMTPSGFALEYGCQGRQLDWSKFTPTFTRGRGSLWGHHFQMPKA